MQRILPFLFLLTCAFTCCDDHDPAPNNTCNVSNPIEDLTWLKRDIEGFKSNQTGVAPYFYVIQSTYKGETVFVYGNCCPHCDMIFPVKNCGGETIDVLATDVAQGGTVIWKPDNSACQL